LPGVFAEALAAGVVVEGGLGGDEGDGGLGRLYYFGGFDGDGEGGEAFVLGELADDAVGLEALEFGEGLTEAALGVAAGGVDAIPIAGLGEERIFAGGAAGDGAFGGVAAADGPGVAEGGVEELVLEGVDGLDVLEERVSQVVEGGLVFGRQVEIVSGENGHGLFL